MNRLSRTLHFTGLQKIILDPLKDHPNEPPIKRVEKILSMLVAADAHRRKCLRLLSYKPDGVPEFLDNFKKMKASECAYRQTLELLNIKLSRYRFETTLSGDIEWFRSEITPAHRKDKWGYSGRGSMFDYTELWKYSEYTESFLAQRDQLLTDERVLTHEEEPQVGWDLMEPFMIAGLLDAVNQGMIQRLRKCLDCHKWFYAVRGHQKFCGNACRRRHEAQSPEFKKKRALYMRETYRPNERKEEALSKQQAARVLSEKSRKG